MNAREASMKRLNSLSGAVAGMLVCGAVGCGGGGGSSTPTAPTTSAVTGPSITIQGSAEAPHELPFTFPVTAKVGSTAQATLLNTLLARLWSVVMPPVQAQATSFALNFDFGLATAQLPINLKVDWDFGDGGKGTYGCTQTSATTLCDPIAKSLSPTHTYSFQSCSKSFTATVVVTAGTQVVTKTFPITLTKTPTIALTSSADNTIGKSGGYQQVNWTTGSCAAEMTIMPDVPWLVRSGTCTSTNNATGTTGMQDVGEGCVGTSGFGTYGRTWRVTANDSGANRTGHINLSVAGGNGAVLTVTQVRGDIPCSTAQFVQVGAAAVSAPKASNHGTMGYSVNSVGPSGCDESVEIGVASSAAWLVPVSIPSSLHLVPSSTGGSSGAYSIQENQTGSPRTATITMTFSGGRPSFTWTVTQAGS